MSKKIILYIFLAFLLLFALVMISSTLGVAKTPLSHCFRIMGSQIPGLKQYINTEMVLPSHQVILLQIRLPRIILAALIGLSLSVVGAVYQGLFNNPMADPYILGVSSGAAFGATLIIVTGIQLTFLKMSALTLAAFAGSVLTTYVVYMAARIKNTLPPITLILAGIAVKFFLDAIISFIMVLNQNLIEKIIMWMMGSVSTASWKQVMFLFCVACPIVLILFFFSQELNIILTGDEAARSLGVDTNRIKKRLIILSSLLIAAAVSVSGIIGFIGLVIPHAVKIILQKNDFRFIIPIAALFGSCFMIFSDTIARLIMAPAEIPVGIITAMFGSPYFLFLLYQYKKKAS
ncbi:MAG: iron chelate uptake ABC transporter family permease subunit [Spirochaetes bacterium]|nr:iron chelate uptake ABC transporter family permease subunit [Spirochaetota bacterium]